MSTLALQHKVQRHRFAQHAVDAVAAHLPKALRSLFVDDSAGDAGLTAAEEATRQAQAVRDMARAYQRTDPGFAADLFAAAARHEGLAAD